MFVTVTCWRSLAENVATSLHKGQPVVVSGRFYMREYTVEEATRTTYELEATTVGHDLSRGVADFQKLSRPPVVSRIELDENGIPSDESDRYLDLDDAEDADPAELATAS